MQEIEPMSHIKPEDLDIDKSISSVDHERLHSDFEQFMKLSNEERQLYLERMYSEKKVLEEAMRDCIMGVKSCNGILVFSR